MIIITGDTHSEKDRFSELFIPDEKLLSGKDYVIVCGDFGFVSDTDERKKAVIDELEKKPYNILFVDGNHENFNALGRLPVEIWNGGKIHRIRKNIIHLMRGQIFTIEDKSFFTLGGAFSIDRPLRIKNISYFEEEIPCLSELEEAKSNLEKHGNCVDYIITHQAPPEIITQIFHEKTIKKVQDNRDEKDIENDFLGYLNTLTQDISFGRWYFGHWHCDRNLGRYRAIYFDADKIS